MADNDLPEASASRPLYASREEWPSHQWVEKMYAENHPFPYSRNRQFAIPFDLDQNGTAQGYASAQLSPNGPRAAKIEWLEAGPQRQGYGSKALKSIMQSAAEHNIALSLFPWDKGGVSKTALTRFYKRHGFKQEKSGRMYFDPAEIKKADGGSVDLTQYQDKTPFGLYSHAAETAAALPQAKGTPEQFKSMLMKQGVKPAEIEHSNYDDVFAGRPSVTKDELVQHFRKSMPVIKEHLLGGAKRQYPQEYYDIETQIGDRYRPRFQSLQQRANDFSLSSQERANAQEDYENLVGLMHREIDRAIPDREDYLEPPKTKFHTYTMPGGENYRELLLQLERGEDNYEKMAGEVYRRKTDLVNQYADLEPGDPRGPEISAQIREATQQYNKLLDKSMASQRKKFTAGHWDEPDVLAHLRMKDRTGPNGEKILHVDEIQSDWGQKGRSNGFEDPKAEERYNAHVERMRDLLREETRKAFEEATEGQNLTPERKEKLLAPILSGVDKMHPMTVATTLKMEDEHKKEVDKLNNSSSGIPHGPYVTNTQHWVDLALKRVLHEAASGGYDKVVFTKGEDHAERYDLSKQIGALTAEPTDNGKVFLVAQAPDNGHVVHQDVHDVKELPNVVGKEVADRIMQQLKFPQSIDGHAVKNVKSGFTSDVFNTPEEAHEQMGKYPDSIKADLAVVPVTRKVPGRRAILEGLDLKVGGEGMRAFYDKVVPKQLMDLTKRLDPEVKLGRDQIDTPEGPKEVHAIKVTPKLRESVLRGQKAFADGGAVEDEGITAYHGSPYDFDKFDINKIGTGEGNQSFGHGLYFAEAEPVAKGYRDRLAPDANVQMGGKPLSKADLKNLAMDLDIPLSGQAAAAMFDRLHKSDSIEHYLNKLNEIDMEGLRRSFPSVAKDVEAEHALISHLHRNNLDIDRPNKGKMYEVRINAHPDHFLDWDKPIAQQKHVMDAIDQHIGDPEIVLYRLIGHENGTGQDLYNALGGKHKAEAVSKKLHEMGIKGVKYLDRGSRLEGEGSRNYVVFDDKLVNIKRKYARGGVVNA